jgi:acid phosphatase class B
VEKTALIITDDSESTRKTAESIASLLTTWKVVSITAGDFDGTQLLPADIYFFGAEKSNPPSFSYLHKMLQHINLAGRLCGIFSASQEAAGYLRNMVRDSELALHPDPFLGEGDIKTWTEKIVKLYTVDVIGSSDGLQS